jgi:S1-C subfamily serine protease
MKIRLFLLALMSVFLAGPLWADMVTVIAKVRPSVVIVGSFSATTSPRFVLRGTGFVVGKGAADRSNLVITNAHVLQRPAQAEEDGTLMVQIRDDRNELQMRAATVLELDRLHDLVLLRFDGAPAPTLAVRDSDSVREGQSVAFMGFPIGGALGYSPVTHRGMISSIVAAALPTPTSQQLNERTIRSLRDGGSFNVFQLDATAYPGNSGGPLFDPETGQVLGVVNMVFIKGTHESALTSPSGISYAIPSKFVLGLLQRHQGD